MVLCAAVAGIQAGHVLRGWVGRGQCSRCSPSKGGPEGVFDDRDERIADLSSPPSHTSLSRHVSVSARSIW